MREKVIPQKVIVVNNYHEQIKDNFSRCLKRREKLEFTLYYAAEIHINDEEEELFYIDYQVSDNLLDVKIFSRSIFVSEIVFDLVELKEKSLMDAEPYIISQNDMLLYPIMMLILSEAMNILFSISWYITDKISYTEYNETSYIIIGKI